MHKYNPWRGVGHVKITAHKSKTLPTLTSVRKKFRADLQNSDSKLPRKWAQGPSSNEETHGHKFLRVPRVG